MLSFKRKKLTRVICLLMALIMIAGVSTVSASAATKSATHYYYCRAHGNTKNDMYVRLSADFSGSTAKNVWFSGSYTHWPNGVTYGNTGKGYGYARGTYNIYSGLVTQWVSLTFANVTDTIYIYN